MSSREQEHFSIWESFKTPHFEPLNRAMSCDVCIIGAGITGLSAAYNLLRNGRSIILLDSKTIGGGETGRTSAHLSNVFDQRYTNIERHHGIDRTRLAVESHSSAIHAIQQIINRERIDCDFEKIPGYLFLASRDVQRTLYHEQEAAKRAGLEVECLDQIPRFSSKSGPCLKFSGQAQFHPLKYLTGLTNAITRMEGKIYTRTSVTSILDGSTIVVRTADGHSVTANQVIVATNTPIHHRIAVHTKQASYRSYVVAMDIPAGYIEPALYWDTDSPFHYARTSKGRNNRDILLVGGEDHRTGQEPTAKDPFEHLETWARQHFPLASKRLYCWSGQIMESIDGLGYIGKDPGSSNIYIATGDSGNGLTHGTIAGILIPDLISSITNPWTSLYDPARINSKSLATYAIENSNTIYQYSSWFGPGEHPSVQDIRPQSGAVIRQGLKKVAVYRDRHGRIYEMSAVCPHLGGVVAWNNCEKTWDCPCHGSRFDKFGKVLNGPAAENLEALTTKPKYQDYAVRSKTGTDKHMSVP